MLKGLQSPSTPTRCLVPRGIAVPPRTERTDGRRRGSKLPAADWGAHHGTGQSIVPVGRAQRDDLGDPGILQSRFASCPMGLLFRFGAARRGLAGRRFVSLGPQPVFSATAGAATGNARPEQHQQTTREGFFSPPAHRLECTTEAPDARHPLTRGVPRPRITAPAARNAR